MISTEGGPKVDCKVYPKGEGIADNDCFTTEHARPTDEETVTRVDSWTVGNSIGLVDNASLENKSIVQNKTGPSKKIQVGDSSNSGCKINSYLEEKTVVGGNLLTILLAMLKKF